MSASFYESDAWQGLRYRTLKRLGRKCMLCGAGGVELHVDHIKPRSAHPELALNPDNLQVLCKPCNLGKGNRHYDDFRPSLARDTIRILAEQKPKPWTERRARAYERASAWVNRKREAEGLTPENFMAEMRLRVRHSVSYTAFLAAKAKSIGGEP